MSERYEVVFTEGIPMGGFGNGNSWEREYAVVDNCNMGHVVACFIAQGRVGAYKGDRLGIEAKFKADSHARKLNHEEQAWEMTG